MTAPAKSIFVFGIYMFLAGATFLLAPNIALPLVGLPATSEVWIRVVGTLMMIIGFYYFCASRIDLRPLYPWTVISRYFVFFVAILLVVVDLAEPPLLIFGVVDFLGATWTLLALRRTPVAATF